MWIDRKKTNQELRQEIAAKLGVAVKDIVVLQTSEGTEVKKIVGFEFFDLSPIEQSMLTGTKVRA